MVALLVLATACSDGGGAESSYTMVVDTVGDTIVARTTGDVPESDVRSLTTVWKSAPDVGDSVTLGDVRGMAVGPDGRVFVWDHVTPTIWLYDATGRVVRRVGRTGAGPGEYDGINGIAVRSDGHLIAWDAGNARLNVYDAQGEAVTSWRLPITGTYMSNAVTADAQNRVWLNASGRLVYDANGTLADSVAVPRYSTDTPLLRARREGMSQGMGVPYATRSLSATSPLGFIVSGPGRPYAVNAQHNGRPLRIEREVAAVPVPEAERSQQRARIEFSMERVQPDWRWDAPDIPTEKPPYSGFAVGSDGRIWVSLHVESEEFEPELPREPRPDAPPVVRFRAKEHRWDVFEPDGRYLGRVKAPRELTAYAMRGDTVWGVLRDDNDVPAIVKMRADFGR